MPGRGYLNFDVSIEKAGDHYCARVLSSMVNNPYAEFSLPPDSSLQEFLVNVSQARGDVSRNLKPAIPNTSDLIMEIGSSLYRAVFSEQVGTCFIRSQDEAERSGKGLRIRLSLRAPEPVGWPWEYLYDRDKKEFLARSAQTPLVRWLDVPQLVTPVLAQPPLRMLVMISSPGDMESLDSEREWDKYPEGGKHPRTAAPRAATARACNPIDPAGKLAAS